MTSGSPLGFQVVNVGARPLLAIPRGAPHIRAAAVRCYPGHTWKKRVVRALLRVAIFSGIDRVMWRDSAAPLEGLPAEEVESWIAEVRRQLARPDAQPVFVWPADAARGRVYGYWLDREARVAAFSKVALDRQNSDLIQNEQRALETLAGLRLQASRVPRVLATGRLRGFAYLIVETAPGDARITHWEQDPSIAEQVREYAGAVRTMQFSDVEPMSWWQRFTEAYRDHPALVETVQRAAADGVDTCRVHGDLNQTNILRTAAGVWLLDWERSCESGPCLTDTVCVEVDRLWPRTRQDAAGSLAEFLKTMWTGQSQEQRKRVLLALAFLCAAEFTPAIALLREWAPQFPNPR